MALPSLFLSEAVSNGDLAVTKLPQDMDLWAETIVSKVKEKLPDARDLLIKVSFLQKNEELGTATGAVSVYSQKLNKTAHIPLIVKNFGLKPLDVMFVPNQSSKTGFDIVPLTKEIFSESMFNPEVFDHLERPIDRIQQLYLNPQNAVVYPPYFRNVYASGTSQVIDSINRTISKEDREEFKNYLKKHASVLVGFEKRSNLEVLKKIANSTFDDCSCDLKDPKVSVALLKKDMNGGVKFSRTSDEVFDPMISDINQARLIDEIGQQVENPEEVLNQVRQNGEYLIFNNLKPKEKAMVSPLHNPGNYTDTNFKPVDAKVFGVYKIMDKNGVIHKGLVFPNLITFDQKVVEDRIFYKAGKCAYQGKIAGVPTMEEPTQFLKFRYPEVGMTGVFVTHNKQNAVATIPITIRSVMDDCGDVKIVAENFRGEKIRIKWRTFQGPLAQSSNGSKEEEFGEEPVHGELRQIVRMKDFYLVPKRFGFLAMDGFCDVMERPSSMSIKTASAVMEASPVRIMHTGHSQFAISGGDTVKMASMLNWDKSNLSAAQAVFLLAAKGCPIKTAAEAIKTAGSHYGQAYVHGLGETKFKSTEKTASKKNEYVRALRVNLIKEASAMEDSQIVDAALSLNFINGENVEKFLGFIPYYEECSRMLAQSLLASRLGMNEIPEQATQTAMYKLVEVIQGLKKLKSDTSQV